MAIEPEHIVEDAYREYYKKKGEQRLSRMTNVLIVLNVVSIIVTRWYWWSCFLAVALSLLAIYLAIHHHRRWK